MTSRAEIIVKGIVQGVGFRPYVYAEAKKRALRGSVMNGSLGVRIEVEGAPSDIEQFVRELKSHAPPLSVVESLECSWHSAAANYPDFQILDSETDGEKFVPLSADIATCDDCLRELFDPNNRRYYYPFINCTNCGPRYTIIEDVPYDRLRTTMRDFEMCSLCRAEYENPKDRRFHAEPIACERCGPKLCLVDGKGEEICAEADVIEMSRQFLQAGEILAIKGIGGFHLACDAQRPAAVQLLRSRKYREAKPFALMAPTISAIERHCVISEAERTLLLSPARPIVLLTRRVESSLSQAIAPGVNTLGFMLPYTPLHHLLLETSERPLVMTSGNISDEPICYEDRDAVFRLFGVADYFLVHNRRIHIRTDDSVARIVQDKPIVVRRSRGHSPAPVKTAFSFKAQMLACGAELKNTFCLARDNFAFISHHIGDLENLETLQSFTDGIEHCKRLFHIEPQVVAHDLHPEYLSTKYAFALPEEIRRIGVQHHHAHIASCMADNQIDGPTIGVAMDGLGFGTDGKLWGGEFLVADFREFQRRAHLAYMPLPGGRKAIEEPWRMAAVYLEDAFGDYVGALDLPFIQSLEQLQWTALRGMIRSGTNCPETSSVGRLFDAIAGLLELRKVVNYEGQAAIELEAIATASPAGWYEFEFAQEGTIIEATGVVRNVVLDLLNGVSRGTVSAKFHLGLAHMIADMCVLIRADTGLNSVTLSGGVFQNICLLQAVLPLLSERGFVASMHHRVPTNDGGLSLGQAAVANALIKAGRI